MLAEGRLAAALRRRRERAEVLASGLVDPAWVAAQVGADHLDPATAAGRLLEDPDLSPHPLVEPSWVAPGRPWLAEGRSGTAWYLADREHRLRSPHPLVSLAVLEDLLPGARTHPAGPVAAWLAHVEHDPDALLPGRPGTPPTRLGDVRRAALAALARGATGSPGSVAAPVVGRTSVVVVGHDAARTVNWIRSVVEARDAGAGSAVDVRPVDVEVVAVAVGPDRAHRVLADTVAAAYGVAPLVVAAAGTDDAAAVSLGLARAAGERVVLVRAGVVPDAGAALRLARVLDDAGIDVVQPLLVDRDGVTVGAGAVAGPSGRAEAFLAGHPPADAEALGRVPMPAALGPVTAFRARGATGKALPRVVLAPDVRCVLPRGLGGTEMPGLAGLPDPTEELLARIGLARRGGRTVRAVVQESPPRLRWTLDTAARAGSGGETWGDTHFARSLAQALRRLGQHVAVDPAPARSRWSRRLDDVVLVLRGLDRVEPTPGPLHLLWVISHPDLVDAEEVAAYDAAFAASLSWSAARSREWGVRVEPLLQCTDPRLFHPGRAAPESGPEVLFVGSSRGVLRPALAGALTGGVRVEVHGGGWAPVLPDLVVASTHVANAELGALYAGAGVVLNDHWEDMLRDGFVSNRLFDATACAARVVSDDIAGLAELFDGQVRAFDEPEEVPGLLAQVPAGFTAYDARLALAARVGAEHSFDHRAATLLDAAVRLRPPPSSDA